MELESLVGKHKFSGLDMGETTIHHDYGGSELVTSISFVLDGVTYTALEDPEDGYRSSMRELELGGEVVNTFPSVEVIAKMKDSDPSPYSGEHDVLQLLNKETKEVIFEIGTANIDDYYPGFHYEWNPQFMSINKKGR